MPAVCLYFQVHQPNRLVPYDFFRIGDHAFYEDDRLNAEILSKVADKCYLPANEMFTRAIEASGGQFKFALSLSGTLIEQMEHHRPDALESFKRLVATGRVELLGETYYHSLAFVHSRREFERQVALHQEKLGEVFSVRPRVFRNTELIYSNAIAAAAEMLGFQGVLGEGVDWMLNGDTPDHLYRAPQVSKIKTLLRNARLSDDLGFRFSDRNWPDWPLTPEKFADWVAQSPGEIVNLFLDYETIGEHQWRDSGIFDFWERLPAVMLDRGITFVTPGEAVATIPLWGRYDCQTPTSWADRERDLSAWMGNVMQREAIEKIHVIEEAVLKKKDPDLTHAWAKLQTSDHFHYMSTKSGTDGEVHDYFSPYASPYDAYIYFMNALADLHVRLKRLPDAVAVSVPRKSAS
jgi:alpha-amylase